MQVSPLDWNIKEIVGQTCLRILIPLQKFINSYIIQTWVAAVDWRDAAVEDGHETAADDDGADGRMPALPHGQLEKVVEEGKLDDRHLEKVVDDGKL